MTKNSRKPSVSGTKKLHDPVTNESFRLSSQFYSITIQLHWVGRHVEYVATCHVFPDMSCTDSSYTRAYDAIVDRMDDEIKSLLRSGKQQPSIVLPLVGGDS